MHQQTSTPTFPRVIAEPEIVEPYRRPNRRAMIRAWVQLTGGR